MFLQGVYFTSTKFLVDVALTMNFIAQNCSSFYVYSYNNKKDCLYYIHISFYTSFYFSFEVKAFQNYQKHMQLQEKSIIQIKKSATVNSTIMNSTLKSTLLYSRHIDQNIKTNKLLIQEISLAYFFFNIRNSQSCLQNRILGIQIDQPLS